MEKNALVIMAAGLGSRYGGIKQLEPVGPNGEIIMDYSIYDAIKAGFQKVIFVIRKDLEEDFKQVIGNRIAKQIETEYVFQELDNLPKGRIKPKGRTKPWGTGQAILSCKGLIETPFLVINADDYYGKEAFLKISDFLKNPISSNKEFCFCMAGFQLKNTLSENGTVTRGICEVDNNHRLVRIVETHNIKKQGDKAIAADENKNIQQINLDRPVSMNMWGYTPNFLEELERGFINFLDNIHDNQENAEYLLPTIVDNLIQEKRAEVVVLETKDTWFGVTYKQDKDYVVKAFNDLIEQGLYPKKLF